ncbi:MAG: flap endonuclease-1 [Candidatus Altiarchaeota archaeon]
MGVNLRDILPPKSLELKSLEGRSIAIDALNSIYQFLSSIRQPDGTPLMDTQGNVTSHLTGLFYRTTRLLAMGIKPIYVFDGKPHPLKEAELEKRRALKEDAQEKYEKAKAEGRIEEASKYARRTSRFTEEMKEDCFSLLSLMGVPAIQAPGEGEAQCVRLCEKEPDIWAVGSMDYDALLLGAPRLVRGLTLSGKIEPGIIDLEIALRDLELTREQLIEVAILVGTDFNPGVKGIGPKKALATVKNNEIDSLDFDFDFAEVKKVFMKPNYTDDYKINWGKVDVVGLKELLCEKHDFAEQRITKTAVELEAAYKNFSQQSISKWF